MLNFWNVSLGIFLITIGVLLLMYEIKHLIKKGRDEYGNYVGVIAGAIGSIILGLYSLISELMKIN